MEVAWWFAFPRHLRAVASHLDVVWIVPTFLVAGAVQSVFINRRGRLFNLPWLWRMLILQVYDRRSGCAVVVDKWYFILVVALWALSEYWLRGWNCNPRYRFYQFCHYIEFHKITFGSGAYYAVDVGLGRLSETVQLAWRNVVAVVQKNAIRAECSKIESVHVASFTCGGEYWRVVLIFSVAHSVVPRNVCAFCCGPCYRLKKLERIGEKFTDQSNVL